MVSKYICPKKCENRKVGCRATCSSWQLYEAEKAEMQAKRLKQIAYVDYVRSNSCKIQHKLHIDGRK